MLINSLSRTPVNFKGVHIPMNHPPKERMDNTGYQRTGDIIAIDSRKVGGDDDTKGIDRALIGDENRISLRSVFKGQYGSPDGAPIIYAGPGTACYPVTKPDELTRLSELTGIAEHKTGETGSRKPYAGIFHRLKMDIDLQLKKVQEQTQKRA